MHGVVNEIRKLDVPNAEMWIAEAEFGFSHVQAHCKKLDDQGRVLEVGCGSGILLSMLAEEFDALTFDGMEPFGDGFSSLKSLNDFVRESGVEIAKCGYEGFTTDKQYDLIFCVNVFEHVNDWQDFLRWVSRVLAKDGIFIVLCPNYAFPYESHFKIPIIFNKSMTERMFRDFITKFETDHEFEGLWQSLNFVKKRDVLRFIRTFSSELKLDVTDDTGIITQMVDRVTTDPEFRKRQRVLGGIALFLSKIGAFRFLNLFRNYLPYMKLQFQKL